MGDGVVAADVVLMRRRVDVVQHQVIDAAGHQRLLAAEIGIVEDGIAAVGCRTRREIGRGQRGGRHVGAVCAAAVIGHQPQADVAAVASRIAATRLPVEAGGAEMAVDGGPEAVGDDLLTPAVDADDGVGQCILPEDTRTVKPAHFIRGQRVVAAAGRYHGLGLATAWGVRGLRLGAVALRGQGVRCVGRDGLGVQMSGVIIRMHAACRQGNGQGDDAFTQRVVYI